MSGSLLAMDVVVLALAVFFFGLAPALDALIAAWVMARVIDALEIGLTAGNTAFIITLNPADVRAGIMERLECGVAIIRGEGAYTGAERTILFTAVNRRQALELREIVRQADPDAFVVISPSNEVLGEGFIPLTRKRQRRNPGESSIS
jgi:uncharacterized membrane-anchored protein YitT (DUF2179 family)